MKTFFAFVTLVSPFWNSSKALGLWTLLFVTLFFELAFVRVSVWINSWNKAFYDALAAFDAPVLKPLIFEYISYIFLAVAMIIIGNWFGKKLCFSWRAAMTQAFQTRWMHAHAHYRLRFENELDNPDQRIAEDIALLAEKSSALIRSFVLNTARLLAFVTILWAISGVQTVRIYSVNLAIYGYLVWIAVGYAIIVTTIMQWIGRNLQQLNIDRQRREADYRTTLLRVREHSEQIAFHCGEDAEIDRMNRRFNYIRRNWRALISLEFKIECFSFTQQRVAWFLPIIATVPLYLGKVITLGDMMQAQSAFSSVLPGFNWFLNYYKDIAEWSAIVSRLGDFNTSLNSATLKSKPHHTKTEGKISATNLLIQTPDGRQLLHRVDLDTRASQWVLLVGPSGVGKTVLFRVLAGLWPYYSGSFELNGNVMFLPQTAYIPHDSPRRVLSYPRVELFEDQTIIAALNDVGLSHLASRLEQSWDDRLSGGERQRLAFARLILHSPDIAVADEATSQLDISASLDLIRILKSRCPKMTFIGTCHQPEIKREFNRVIHLSKSATTIPLKLPLQLAVGTKDLIEPI